MDYFSPRAQAVSSRRVDPYGLALRRGIWSLVGYCHLRKDIRTFHVHRIRGLTVNAAKPRSPDFARPKDFQLDAYVATFPWQHRFHAPIDVELRLTGSQAPFAERLFPGAALTRDGATSRVTVRATFLDGLLRQALSLAPDCQVLGPPEARQRFEAMANAAVERHGGAA